MNDQHPIRRLQAAIDASTGPSITVDRADVAVVLRLVDRFTERWLTEATGHLVTSAELDVTRAALDQAAEDLTEAARITGALTDRLLDTGDRAGLVAVLRHLRAEAAT